MPSNDYQLTIPLYHVDSEENNRKFIRNGSLPATIEDGDWAGNGLYFWDNIGNAKYWIKKDKDNNANVKLTILKVLLSASENKVLDLTEPETVKNFEHMVTKLSESFRRKFTWDSNQRGSIINAFYDLLVEITHGDVFQVVKLIGYYPSAPNSDFFSKGDESSNLTPHVTIKSKTIYSIRDQELIKKPSIMMGDELNDI